MPGRIDHLGPSLELVRTELIYARQTRQWIAESTGTGPREATRNFPQLAKKSARLRVLVVDDEPLFLWSISETLGARGYQVIQADNGAAAIRALLDPPGAIDVVLLDLRLPDFTDLSLLAVMRRLAPSTPIIVMTAFATVELVERALQLGAFTVINKPFELNELTPLILRVVSTPRASEI
jgi:DNA-binding NtrC family response regulator